MADCVKKEQWFIKQNKNYQRWQNNYWDSNFVIERKKYWFIRENVLLFEVEYSGTRGMTAWTTFAFPPAFIHAGGHLMLRNTVFCNTDPTCCYTERKQGVNSKYQSCGLFHATTSSMTTFLFFFLSFISENQSTSYLQHCFWRTSRTTSCSLETRHTHWRLLLVKDIVVFPCHPSLI